ncbi:MAG: hypothetical protein P8P74_15295 [Crocinitomicaceae bacterium]|nr:hypothetical protein [Crocinitomicaceae bacterium]
MKYVLFIFTVLAIASCEKRQTSFDPDNQLVSADEFAQIDLWNQDQTDRLSSAEYERQNAEEFVNTEYNYRQDNSGKWVIEGSVANFASEIHYKDVQLVLSYYDDSKTLIGTENYTIREYLAPGDKSGFYFKSDKYNEAISMEMEVLDIKPVS